MSQEITRPARWRWAIGAGLIFSGWQFTGLLLTVGAANLFGYQVDLIFSTDPTDMAQVRAQPAWSTAATVLVSFIPLFLFTILAYRLILNLPVKKLFTSRGSFSWALVWVGFASMTAMLVISAGGDIAINPSNYSWNWNLSAFLAYLLVAFTLLPIQTTAEELFFRGWLQQWFDNGKRRIWSVSLFGGLVFAAPHMANPEVNGNNLLLPLISYGATGFMFSWVTFRDKGLEIAIGAHFANNLIAALFVSTDDSALPSVSLFTSPNVAWGAAALTSLIMVPIFIWLTGKWRAKVMS